MKKVVGVNSYFYLHRHVNDYLLYVDAFVLNDDVSQSADHRHRNINLRSIHHRLGLMVVVPMYLPALWSL